MYNELTDILNATDKMISEMFKDYLCSTEDEERHTEEACKEVDSFDRYCEKVFPQDIKAQLEMYDKMMDVAVEFEESGFIAGFKWAVGLLNKHGETLISPSQNTPLEE